MFLFVTIHKTSKPENRGMFPIRAIKRILAEGGKFSCLLFHRNTYIKAFYFAEKCLLMRQAECTVVIHIAHLEQALPADNHHRLTLYVHEALVFKILDNLGGCFPAHR